MNSISRFAGVLLMGLALLGSAQAQSKKELVARVIQLQQPVVEGMARNIAAATVQEMWQATIPALGQLPADKRETVAKDVQSDFKNLHEAIEPLLLDRVTKLAPGVIAPVLEEKFSEEELKQVVAWLESSAAKKLNEVAPGLMANLQQKLMADTRPQVEPKMRKLEETVRKKLGLPANPAASAPATPAKKAGAPSAK